MFEFELRATYLGSLRAKLILASLGMPNSVWPLNNIEFCFSPTSTLPPSMHQKPTEHGYVANQPAPYQKSCWVSICLYFFILPVIISHWNHPGKHGQLKDFHWACATQRHFLPDLWYAYMNPHHLKVPFSNSIQWFNLVRLIFRLFEVCSMTLKTCM